MFIIIYIINVSTFRIRNLFCSFSSFYIINTITLSRISCSIKIFSTYPCEVVRQTAMIASVTQCRAKLAVRCNPSLTTSSTLTNRCSIDCYPACRVSACTRAAKSIVGLYCIYCIVSCAVIVA